MINKFSFTNLKSKFINKNNIKINKSKLDPNNEFDASLLKLDKVYQEIQDIDDNIKLLNVKKEQLQEDAELMEMLLMHKMNKDNRIKDFK